MGQYLNKADLDDLWGKIKKEFSHKLLISGANLLLQREHWDGSPISKVSDITLSTITLSSIKTFLGVGASSGIAELDENGLVPSSQLPSYVDDVINLLAMTDTAPSTCAKGDKYYNTTGKKIFTATATNTWGTTGETPESGKIYINTANNKTYRWSGSDMAEISESLALGETSSTAYRGDRGKIAYDHATDANRLTTAKSSAFYKFATTAEGHIKSVTAVIWSDITALDNGTTYAPYNASGYQVTVPKLGSTTKPVYTSAAGSFAECSTYAGGTKVTLNGTNKGASSITIFAPTTSEAADSGKWLKSNGAAAPVWETTDNMVAGTAKKLNNTSLIGNTNKPVYFTAQGVPAACDYELNKNVPSDAVFTDTATATDDILDGSNNGTAVKYAPYDSTTANSTWVGTAGNAGKLYLGTVNPSKTTRLNYNGYFYATKLYSGAVEVVTLSATQALTNKTYNGYTLAAACAKDVLDNSSATAFGNGSSNIKLVTERAVYFALPTINGAHDYTSSTTIFAPTTVGTSGHVLTSGGSGNALGWTAQSSLVAGKATQLQNKRTLWGQEFNGTANVSGDMSSVGDVKPSGDNTKILGDSSNNRYWATIMVNAVQANTTLTLKLGSTAKATLASTGLSVVNDITSTNGNIAALAGGVAAYGIADLGMGGGGGSGTLTQIKIGTTPLADVDGVVTIPLAASGVNGAMLGADKVRLDNLALDVSGLSTDNESFSLTVRNSGAGSNTVITVGRIGTAYINALN